MRQTTEGGNTDLVATLRRSVWRFGGQHSRRFAEGFGGNARSLAQALTHSASQRPVRHQARLAAENPDSHPYHHWDETQPGFVEADTVAHCGNSLAGDFVWTLTMTDIITGWTECRATWNKGSQGVLEQIQAVENLLPFPLKGFDCDNGSEFLNQHLLRYFTDHPQQPAFTRSRPYKKNDNAHVEQKNWTHARQLFGYDRLDNVALVPLMNEVYSTLWCPLQNHFCPSLKLQKKHRDGAKIVKKYHAPQTPYQRVIVLPDIPETTEQTLRNHHASSIHLLSRPPLSNN